MTTLSERLAQIRQNAIERHTEGSEEESARHLDNLRATVHRAVVENVASAVYSVDTVDPSQDEILESIATELSAADTPLSAGERRSISNRILDDILGYGPITQYLVDESVTEVMVNRHDLIYIERNGLLERTDTEFSSENELRRVIEKIVNNIGRRIDESSPMVDARLPDGSRVNAVVPPLAIDGSCLTIRRFKAEMLTIDRLVEIGTLSQRAATFLSLCVAGKANVLISGGTGSGKTTTLNVLSSAIPDNQRIITIEDSAELQLSQEHVVRLESRPSNIEKTGAVEIRDLVKNALRMRPDRIIIGECRDGEAVDMLQAMNTGHDGSMTTLHANTPREALYRLETLVLMSGVELPARAIREQIAGAIDMVVQIERLVDGSRRITHITEVSGIESDTITLQDIFTAPVLDAEHNDGKSTLRRPLAHTGVVPRFMDKLLANGVRFPTAVLSGSDDGGQSSNWILDNKGKGKAKRVEPRR